MTASSDHGRAASRERLIESHLPLVRAIARRYAGRGEALDDLIQVGAVALVRASDRFDPERGVSFATFAAPAVEGEIRRHLGDQSGSVRIPRQVRQMTGELERSRSRLAARLGRAPTVEELATALGVERLDVERALEAERARDPVPGLSEDSLEASADTESLAASDDRLLLEKTAHVLDERERRIIFLRFHADLTEREISREVGVSQAQVSRSLTKALGKLRDELDRDPASPSHGDTTEKPAISDSERPSQQDFHGSAGRKRPASEAPEIKIGAVGASEEQAQQIRTAERTPESDPARPYHVTVKPGAENQGSPWIASVDEMAGCEAGGATPDEAVENLRAAMESWLSAAAEEPKVMTPTKRSSKQRKASSHSGRFLVRMPSTLHEELTRAAEREEVSLNRFVTAQLAASVAPAATGSTKLGIGGQDQPPAAPERRGRGLRVLLAANVLIMVVAAAAAVALLILALERGL
ncbi:MAG TPA: sigma-70 family RNA polymerase sigma factor [Solirubrobacteraceae bacterium]|nr:sigma-70 family RNA polymerase sigma factor [Solirubrobacteraceae bacterium]